MTNNLTQEKIMQALDWAYEKAVDGVPGLGSAEELARDYLNRIGNAHEQANELIRWQNAKAGTSGFLNGLPGILLMPVTIPVNITSVMYIQVQMIAAIAFIGGHDIRNDKVKTLIYCCLCGNAAKDILKEVGIKIGTKITQQAIRNISMEVIVKINQAVGFRLITKFGQTGLINIGKTIPLAGGFIGATFDSVTTNIIGNIARDTFIKT